VAQLRIVLARGEAISIRKHPERSATSRLFLLLAASLFTVAGFADLIICIVITGTWYLLIEANQACAMFETRLRPLLRCASF
jgi:hypothetical protein